MEDSPESLAEDEVCRGQLYKAGRNGYTRKSFDILASFLDVLGRPAAEAPVRRRPRAAPISGSASG